MRNEPRPVVFPCVDLRNVCMASTTAFSVPPSDLTLSGEQENKSKGERSLPLKELEPAMNSPTHEAIWHPQTPPATTAVIDIASPSAHKICRGPSSTQKRDKWCSSRKRNFNAAVKDISISNCSTNRNMMALTLLEKLFSVDVLKASTVTGSKQSKTEKALDNNKLLAIKELQVLIEHFKYKDIQEYSNSVFGARLCTICVTKGYRLWPLSDIKDMDDDSEDIYTGHLIKRYTKRPASLEHLTLADWAAWYDGDTKPYLKQSKELDSDSLLLEVALNEVNDDDYNDDDDNHTHSKCKSSKKNKRRKIARIIRSVCFNKETEPEKYFRELIMLFTSWRNENTDLIGNCSTYQDYFSLFAHKINENMKEYVVCNEDLNEIQNHTNSTEDMDHQYDLIAPSTQNVECQDEAEGNQDLQPDLNEKYNLSDDIGIPSADLNHEPLVLNEMQDEDYRHIVQMLNKEQKEFFYHVLHLIKTSDEPFYCFLSGGAGVGKSVVTKALYQAALKYYNQRAGVDFTQVKVLLLAPTGKAANNIKGNTIHTALGISAFHSLKTYKSPDSSRLNTLRCQLGHIKLIFVDEISMVGNSMFNIQINNRLKDIKGSQLPFGAVSIVAVGDLFQLQPVMDGYLFKDLDTDYSVLAPNLWQQHFKMFELHEIMRQRESKMFAQLLNRLREGKHTCQDIMKLKERLIDSDSTAYLSVPHLFIQNVKVNKFNDRVHHTMSGPKFSIKAHDTVIGAQSQKLREKILKQIPLDQPNKTSQLHTVLHLAVGERTDISLNVRTDDGLTNGAGNIIKLIQTQETGKPSGIIWVQFDCPDVGEKTRHDNRHLYKQGIEPTWTPIKPVTSQFAVGRNRTAQVLRKQFPLRPAAAKTIHRSQGDTVDKIVVNFDARKAIPHIHYVGLSRVTTIEGLHIIDLCEDKIAVNTDVQKEMERLRTEAKLHLCINPVYNADQVLLKVCYLNARSLHRHIEDVQSDLNYSSTDVNIFTETRFCHSDDESAYIIDNYSLFRNDGTVTTTNLRPYGGTAVYSRVDYYPGYPYSCNSHGIEITAIRLMTAPHIHIFGIYRSPSVPFILKLLTLCPQLVLCARFSRHINKVHYYFYYYYYYRVMMGLWATRILKGVKMREMFSDMLFTYGMVAVVIGVVESFVLVVVVASSENISPVCSLLVIQPVLVNSSIPMYKRAVSLCLLDFIQATQTSLPSTKQSIRKDKAENIQGTIGKILTDRLIVVHCSTRETHAPDVVQAIVTAQLIANTAFTAIVACTSSPAEKDQECQNCVFVKADICKPDVKAAIMPVTCEKRGTHITVMAQVRMIRVNTEVQTKEKPQDSEKEELILNKRKKIEAPHEKQDGEFVKSLQTLISDDITELLHPVKATVVFNDKNAKRKKKDEPDVLFDQLNHYHPNIVFTAEENPDHFLDTAFSYNNKFNCSVFKKPGKLPTHWKSEVPTKWKRNCISGALHRAKCTSTNLDKDIKTLETSFINAGYLKCFISHTINNFLNDSSQDDNIIPNFLFEDRKKVFIKLPFCSKNEKLGNSNADYTCNPLCLKSVLITRAPVLLSCAEPMLGRYVYIVAKEYFKLCDVQVFLNVLIPVQRNEDRSKDECGSRQGELEQKYINGALMMVQDSGVVTIKALYTTSLNKERKHTFRCSISDVRIKGDICQMPNKCGDLYESKCDTKFISPLFPPGSYYCKCNPGYASSSSTTLPIANYVAPGEKCINGRQKSGEGLERNIGTIRASPPGICQE
ncbi:ATP-dependent DNA helicase PIF1 [Stylophora pistillata]|uniref:ATP-dependent DNA helicase n=1 Tax=Stylophora pistillata TaxID=50429 RepID=A0A2B4RGA4_STYPI|nr:ATP-dependent DNA helicase PIF1 [Stylophora pistillata]